MADRSVPEGTTVTFTTAAGAQRELVAEGGVIHPETPEDEAILDAFGYEAVQPEAKPRAAAKTKPDTGEEG